MKKLNIGLIALAGGMLLLSSCSKAKNSPGYEYMGQTDMYRSPSYKAYENNPVFSNGLTMQGQVDGTVPHSFDREKMINYMPFNYSNTITGRDSAIAYLKNPLAKSEENMKNGEYIYGIYCATCHGKTGKGDGPVVKLLSEKRDNMGLLPPAYDSDQLKNATEGQIFYATQYGKGNMGSYAPLLSAHERWQVVMFVQTLQGGTSSDTTSTPKDSLPK